MLDKTTRRSIKKEARKNLRRRFFLNVIVVFIVSIVINGGYQYASRTTSLTENNSTLQGVANTVSEISVHGKKETNAEILGELLSNVFEFKYIEDPSSVRAYTDKYSAGAISAFVNSTTGSQSFIFGIVNGINTLVFDGRVGNSVVIFVFSGLSIAFFIFVKNVIVVGKDRYYLEQRRYSGTRAKEILFPYKNRRAKNITLTMLSKYGLQLLWDLTIVFGPIKHYEYLLIPYILAENPRIKREDAFALSKELMKGEKWNYFLMDVTLLPWRLLSYLSFNISAIFWSDPYFECIRAEFYMRIRDEKKEKLDPRLASYFIDDALDVPEVMEGEHPSGIEELDIKLPRMVDEKRDYMRSYSFQSIVQLFFTYAFVGYVWEVFYTLADEGVLCNRGTLHGPWVPIYGVGGLIIILVLKPLRSKPWLMFIGTTVACGILEYFTAWALETIFDTKWWDYTGYFLNLDGRICLEGLMVFGLAGIAFTYVCSPILDDFYERFPLKKRKVVCTILIILFVADVIWSAISPNTGKGVTTSLSPVATVETEQEA